MGIQAFVPMGQTVAIVTNAGANTSSNATIFLAGVGTGFVFPVVSAAAGIFVPPPPQVRILNGGTSLVFLSFNLAARTAVIPVAGVNQIEYPLLPNASEVFGLPSGWIPGPPLTTPSIIVATISAGASQPLYLTFGEGV